MDVNNAPVIIADVDHGKELRSVHQAAALERVVNERVRQDVKFGWLDSASPGSTLPKGDFFNDRKLAVLVEEVGEVAEIVNDTYLGKRPRRRDLHDELAQVAACAVAWIEADLEEDRSELLQASFVPSEVEVIKVLHNPDSTDAWKVKRLKELLG